MTESAIIIRAQNAKMAYASRFTQTAQHLAEHDVYKRMVEFTSIMQQTLAIRHNIPESRPIVHVDIGSGTGHFLGALSQFYTEQKRNHCLIGVEVNDLLANFSVARLQDAGHAVEEHIHGRDHIEVTGGQEILRRTYSPNNRTLDAMNVTPDKRIIILQDDARRNMSILFSVLQKLEKLGHSHVDSISYGLPGAASDIAIEDSAELSRGNNSLALQYIPIAVTKLMENIQTLAAKILQKEGTMIFFQRIASGNDLYAFYKRLTGKEFPTDGDAQVAARIFLSFALYQLDPQKFRPLGGAVLVPELEKIEAETAIDYALYSPNSQRPLDVESKQSTRDLFGMGVKRLLQP